jgi:trimeric autotransporter adhesin
MPDTEKRLRREIQALEEDVRSTVAKQLEEEELHAELNNPSQVPLALTLTAALLGGGSTYAAVTSVGPLAEILLPLVGALAAVDLVTRRDGVGESVKAITSGALSLTRSGAELERKHQISQRAARTVVQSAQAAGAAAVGMGSTLIKNSVLADDEDTSRSSDVGSSSASAPAASETAAAAVMNAALADTISAAAAAAVADQKLEDCLASANRLLQARLIGYGAAEPAASLTAAEQVAFDAFRATVAMYDRNAGVDSSINSSSKSSSDSSSSGSRSIGSSSTGSSSSDNSSSSRSGSSVQTLQVSAASISSSSKYANYSLKELKEAAKACGVKISGTKAQLVDRILAAEA